MDGIRIDATRIADGIGLIDAFRRAGFAAGFAGAPGTWDVDVASTLALVAPILLDWMAANGRELMVAHVDGHAYLVSEPAAVPVA